MYFHRPPFWMRWAAPKAIWRMNAGQKVIYLTFDDGPTPGITDRLLQILEKENVRATFFCLGERASNHPELFAQLKKGQHTIGHHSFSHLNGWNTDDRTYMEDVEYGASIVGGEMFRPPYGKLRRAQLRYVSSMYRVVMWSLMPGDFDPKVSVRQCLQIAVNKTRGGDILVFHDNAKCGDKMLRVVEDFIPEMKKRGFSFAALPR